MEDAIQSILTRLDSMDKKIESMGRQQPMTFYNRNRLPAPRSFAPHTFAQAVSGGNEQPTPQGQTWRTVQTRKQKQYNARIPQQHPHPITQPTPGQRQHSNQPHPQHNPSTNRNNQPTQTRQNQSHTHHTDNPIFAPLLKMLYRGTQLRHHANNWGTLPNPVERRIHQLFEFLTPPVPTDEIKSELDSLMNSLKHDIRSTVLTHINTQIAINNSNLKQATIQDDDREAARGLAEKVLRKQYGRKANQQHLDEWLAADMAIVGLSNKKTIASDNTAATTPSVDESATVVLQAASSEDAMEAQDCTQQNRKRRRDSTETAVPISNRFEVLTDEPEELNETTETNPKKILATSPKNNKQNIIITSPKNDIQNAIINTNDDSMVTEVAANHESEDTWSMTSSQCDALLASQKTTNSLNHSTTQPHKAIFIHENQPKSQWKLTVRNSPVTVLLTDSNFRLSSNIPIPDDWEIHVYPGCTFMHATKLLRTAEIPSCVKDIVLAVGINNRGWNFTKSVKPDWNKMITQARSLKQNVHFLGVSTTNPCETIKTVNEEAKKQFGQKFIAPLPEDQVTIPSTDPHKIHHDKTTVAKIIDSIKFHLN